MREKNFKQTIPKVMVGDGEAITYETAATTVRRGAHYFSSLQASDGHWPAENSGPLFFLPPLVSLLNFSPSLKLCICHFNSHSQWHNFVENSGHVSIHYRAS